MVVSCPNKISQTVKLHSQEVSSQRCNSLQFWGHFHCYWQLRPLYFDCPLKFHGCCRQQSLKEGPKNIRNVAIVKLAIKFSHCLVDYHIIMPCTPLDVAYLVKQRGNLVQQPAIVLVTEPLAKVPCQEWRLDQQQKIGCLRSWKDQLFFLPDNGMIRPPVM